MILDNLRDIQRRIEAAAKRSGRDPKEIEIAAVTKKAALDDIRAVLGTGDIRFLGENRVQDAKKRRETLGDSAKSAKWRFIGHLQNNKAAEALTAFEWIDSLDSLKLARTLDAAWGKTGSKMDVLIQVNLAGKETQSGVAPEDIEGFLDGLKEFPALAPRGLMAIAPMLEPAEAVRPFFRRMKELLDLNFRSKAAEGRPTLSMGMSRDFEVAVEEGATLLRIGTALFLPQTVSPRK